MAEDRVDERRRRPSVWQHYRRYWLVALVVTALMGGLGVVAALVRPPVYTAETRLAVGSAEMNAFNIPGFPSASEEMASNYSRWVTHQGVQGIGTPPGTIELTASPIVESNVLRIEATSLDQATALRAVQESADGLVAAVNEVAAGNDPEPLLESALDLIGPLTEARQANEEAQYDYQNAINNNLPTSVVERLLGEYVATQRALQALDLERDGLEDRYRRLVANSSTEAQLSEISPPAIVSNDRMAVLQRNGLLGAIFGFALAGLVVTVLGRRHQAEPRHGSVESADAEAESVESTDDEAVESPDVEAVESPGVDGDEPGGNANEAGSRDGGVGEAADPATAQVDSKHVDSKHTDEDEHVAFVDARSG